ncbi:class I SAM-dependent methyltransferase [Ignatzschineria rhizosphaerae]|uniref:Class I SAM-dependent methyltransferase n=1 Tax=Ignatzschineria rhizosphaerae TaxID=2923279 RepID=A0ABY3X0U7_9GAMM|nr:class I SAM-dependent methyltransferase [Ignatzschineria rhizosphaerae]UNM95087.1 class I SAM-dependent methyltransferase [Ignatzschineria rhizosphaerae]
MTNSTNWFESGGEQYAQYRPQYPESLGKVLASLTKERHKALDIGCGTGQLTTILANHFDKVTGIDPSESQIHNAKPHPNISYDVANAEELPTSLSDINLITVAQAAHWLDLPKFYQEIKKVSAPNALLALISYGILQSDAHIKARFDQFYHQEIGSYWPSERKMVEEGYQNIHFPFPEIPVQDAEIKLEWNFEAFMGYISTWSAVRKAQDAGKTALLLRFHQDILELWGDPKQLRIMTWPIKMRVGKIHESLRKDSEIDYIKGDRFF